MTPGLPPPGAIPTLADLGDRGRFEPLLEIPHGAVAEAIRPCLFRFTWITGAYWGANGLILAWILLAGRASGLGAMEAFSAVGLGMVATWAVMLPIHEHIHAWAYRRVGAAVNSTRPGSKSRMMSVPPKGKNPRRSPLASSAPPSREMSRAWARSGR